MHHFNNTKRSDLSFENKRSYGELYCPQTLKEFVIYLLLTRIRSMKWRISNVASKKLVLSSLNEKTVSFPIKCFWKLSWFTQKLLTDQSARKVPLRMAPLCVGSTIELTHWNNFRHLIDARLIRWINDHQTIQFFVVIGIETYFLFSNFNENVRRITTLVSLRKRSNKKPSF